jgi:hypothetical protein
MALHWLWLRTSIDYTRFDFKTVKTYSSSHTAWGNDLSQRRVLTEFDDADRGSG